MSSQPPMGGHLAIPQNGILHRNEPPMSFSCVARVAAHSRFYCSLFSFFAFFTKKISEVATACLFHLLLQAFVATIIKLKARVAIIFRNCEKSNGMMGTLRKGGKSAIQNK